MENNQEKDNKAPKFNFSSYWIYGIIILVLLGYNFYLKMHESTKVIDVNTFEEKVKTGEVDRVEIINKEMIHVFLRKEIIEAKYPEFKDNGLNINQPQYSFRIGDIGTFEELLRELKSQGFPVNYKVRQETNYLIHSQLVAAFCIITRLMAFYYAKSVRWGRWSRRTNIQYRKI
ncbi:MAG: ATP-dependent metallopeptidase FtsH/Yme1/Tma family protein [Saprospiraceae bacterium]|nr:ATP-dependent metallopeptidase FtsH/Yme1/Tma family protein [Saprospiraceae bacterium]